ncbi:hypothetical protein GQ54DRAFT_307875 [Martensiomyces pterosporus]|nr:hypothetical protein GQ54DRAFT_307875 [Martensiomyces pterosporus]
MSPENDSEIGTPIAWPDGAADRVEIYGTFSRDSARWWQDAIPLARTPLGGYSTRLLLQPGTYEFKFVVNGSDWRVNAAAYDTVDDGHGNINNVIVVPHPAAKRTSSSSAPNSHPPEVVLTVDAEGAQGFKHIASEHIASERTALLGKRPSPHRTGSHSGSSQAQGHSRSISQATSSTQGEGFPSSEQQAGLSSGQQYLRAAILVLLFALLGVFSALFYS